MRQSSEKIAGILDEHISAHQEKIISTPIGNLRLTAKGGAIAGLDFPNADQTNPKLEASRYCTDMEVNQSVLANNKALAKAEKWLLAFLDIDSATPLPPMPATNPDGSNFQKKVWRQLQKIPCGETRTYGQIATELGMPKSGRAVGQANGKNPIPILIPCHRVLSASGLGGYSLGLDLKMHLLAIEGASASASFENSWTKQHR